jgi:hypothetical protein
MKHLFFIAFFFCLTHTFAQQLHLQGSIINDQSNKPIAAATISVLSKNLYFSADKTGDFNIISDKISITDSIAFSCIGYQTKKIKADHVQNLVIKLSPIIDSLSEVKINYKSLKTVKVGSKAKSDDLMSSCMPDQYMAMFMDGSTNVKGIIKTVHFYLGNGHILSLNKGGDVTAPFMVKLYAVDSAGAPGRELTKDSIIVSAKTNNSWFSVDLSKFKVENPDSGFFVAFCVLDIKHYKINDSRDQDLNPLDLNSAEIMSPRLGTTKYEFKQTRSYWGGYNSDWIINCKNYSYMIRAEILPYN